MRRRTLAAGALACLVLLVAAGCGGSSGKQLLSETASNLGKIRSGTLHFALLVTPKGTGGQEVGFELDGPFSLPKPGGLPVAKFDYTQVLGAKRATVTLVSTGHDAFVEVGDKAYALRSDQVEQLRGASDSLQLSGGLGRLGIAGWIRDPRTGSCGSLAPGQDVDCVHAKLNVTNAANDLLALTRQLGRDAPRLTGADAKELERSIRQSDISLASGHSDRVLRALDIDLDLGLAVPSSLQGVLGALVGAHVHLALELKNLNQPVSVTAPANPLPYSALPRG